MAPQPSPQALRALLDEFFDQHLPITRYLNMRTVDYDGASFSLAIDLQPSLNDKLTAFGGSLYCVAVMCGWGMIYLQCRQRGLNPNMVVSHAEIDYLAPVADELIVARCQNSDKTAWDDFVDRARQGQRVRTRVTASISSGGVEAVRFRGEYAVIGVLP